jgi:hypothetical protein
MKLNFNFCGFAAFMSLNSCNYVNPDKSSALDAYNDSL